MLNKSSELELDRTAHANEKEIRKVPSVEGKLIGNNEEY
jgi:hypothetical protein